MHPSLNTQPVWLTFGFWFLFCIFSVHFSYWGVVHYPQWLLLGATVLFGLPHGLSDPWLWRVTNPSLGLFLVTYLGLFVLCLVFWFCMPMASLSVFLLLTCWHFGSDWSEHNGLGLVLGSGLLAWPCYFHPAACTDYIQLITPAFSTYSLTYTIAIMCYVSALSIVFLPRRLVLLAAAVMLSAYCLEPLTYFILYFCTLHSPSHMYTMYQQGHLSEHNIVYQCGLFLLSLSLLTTLLWFTGLDSSLIPAFFGFIFSVSVPHILCVDLLGHRGA